MAAKLPGYVASAQPVPQENRAPWYKSTAPAYAGIMLWFVFWQQVPPLNGSIPGGGLAAGLPVAILGLIIAALICHYLFYVVPGKFGMKTGLPLYVVGTSTYGVAGGYILPGLLMGALQFGWLSVNAFFATKLLCQPFGVVPGTVPFAVVGIAFVLLATVLGIAGIQYVARVGTYLPILPLIVLLVLTGLTIGGLGKFDAKQLVADVQGATAAKSDSAENGAADNQTGDNGAAENEEAAAAGEAEADQGPTGSTSPLNIILVMTAVIVGFFATAGAAGVDFGMNNRDDRDVQLGGLTGIAGAIVLTGLLSLLIMAGAYGLGYVDLKEGVPLTPDIMSDIPALGTTGATIMWYMLAIAAFPAACFASFIGANSFRTMLPKVNPYISCGVGALVAIILVVTTIAQNAAAVFEVIGASFGPICGAMAADYLLAGRRWAGPRAGFNPAGWISWVVGFVVGGIDLVLGTSYVPCPPVAAFIVGFGLYFLLAMAGLESKTLPMPGVDAEGGEAASHGDQPSEGQPSK